ncbi:UNVERIFIED_CONTAM: hypothetical protein RMT77_007669 [Armadillidium vulgare]
MESLERNKLIDHYEKLIKDESISYAIAAMKAVLCCSEEDCSTTTMQEFIAKLKKVRGELQRASPHVSVRSGCELLVRYMTFSQPELEQATDFKSCRKILLSRGRKYIEKMDKSREQVVESCKFLIKDDMVILTHSRSRNVLATMIKAAQQGKHFKVYVTEAQPLCEGKRMFSDLRKYNIPCTLILDSAISYIIEKIDAVLLGAEGVCENGGIINRIGTCNVATIANLKNKPVYVLVESFKFIRLIPLNNSSIPKEYLYPLNHSGDLEKEHPLVDYTPPSLITLLYTDLGILPTSAVTEHLIKMYT